VFLVFPVCCRFVVSTSAVDCLERLLSEMTYYLSSRTLNPTHSLAQKIPTDIAHVKAPEQSDALFVVCGM